MRVLYGANENIAKGTGAGIVSYYESESLTIFGDMCVLDASRLRSGKHMESVWEADELALLAIKNEIERTKLPFSIAHFYGGPYPKTFAELKNQGCKILVTIPAHDRMLSIEEAEIWYGKGSFPFSHIKNDDEWFRYTEHIRAADVVIAPSSNSKKALIKDAKVDENKIVIIPHGTDIPEESSLKPLPKRFTVCYMSQVGPDKGVIYLIKAWSDAHLADSELIFAGTGTDQLQPMINQLASDGIFVLLGRVDHVSDVYNQSSVAILPSVNEGFGITTLEAMAHRRPVIVGEGAGSHDAVDEGCGIIVPIRNPQAITKAIAWFYHNQDRIPAMGERARIKAKTYSWDLIIKKYREAYHALLS